MDFSPYFEANKKLWNKRTAVHKESSFYDIAGFKKGKDVLTPIELAEVGDVKGKKLLHLQCHFGMDSLNWARKGAEVTGVDLSDEAIKEARLLNKDMGLEAAFVCCNVYDLHPQQLSPVQESPLGAPSKASFDIIFCSYGVVGWLPDLDKWAEIIAYYLKPGGFFYLAEFHPVIWMFNDDFTELKYCYEKRDVIETEMQGTYTDLAADIKVKEYGWNHSISEVLNALIGQGLEINSFNEYMYSPYPCFNPGVQNKEGNWWIKGLEDKIPMVYSVKAIKK
jgi:SAM-dependent methyltransferase